MRMLSTGKVEVVNGFSAAGQGHETAWSQIVADQLGVPFEDIRVLHGDTQVSPKGMDTYGSRSLAVGGLALVDACDKVIDKAKVIAAGMLEASAGDLEFSAGRCMGTRKPDAAQTLDEAAPGTFAGHNLPHRGAAATIASTPAVVNAIIDALRPLGVRDVTMPCSPERVWRAIQAASANGGNS